MNKNKSELEFNKNFNKNKILFELNSYINKLVRRAKDKQCYITFLKKIIKENNIKINNEDYKKFKRQQKWGYYDIEEEELRNNNPCCNASLVISEQKSLIHIHNSLGAGDRKNYDIKPPHLSFPPWVAKEDSPSIGRPSPIITAPTIGPQRIDSLYLQHFKTCVVPVKIEVEDLKEEEIKEREEKELVEGMNNKMKKNIKEGKIKEVLQAAIFIKNNKMMSNIFKGKFGNLLNYIKRWKKKNKEKIIEEVQDALANLIDVVDAINEGLD